MGLSPTFPGLCKPYKIGSKAKYLVFIIHCKCLESFCSDVDIILTGTSTFCRVSTSPQRRPPQTAARSCTIPPVTMDLLKYSRRLSVNHMHLKLLFLFLTLLLVLVIGVVRGETGNTLVQYIVGDIFISRSLIGTGSGYLGERKSNVSQEWRDLIRDVGVAVIGGLILAAGSAVLVKLRAHLFIAWAVIRSAEGVKHLVVRSAKLVKRWVVRSAKVVKRWVVHRRFKPDPQMQDPDLEAAQPPNNSNGREGVQLDTVRAGSGDETPLNVTPTSNDDGRQSPGVVTGTEDHQVEASPLQVHQIRSVGTPEPHGTEGVIQNMGESDSIPAASLDDTLSN
ncbi:hypothetical protein K504DRAFT_532127 [Pleomassaria siparia CBS 279.74]|uniref:Uncharacterized protein n=1 Tax=Pleomassaria siparia CBS 279.74 TaxID=1314801 RepID=A0A6G1KG81_9PLEO|nr:hypothetical protein K504DRAFT_532127 [Pleomassaria siparia CBS 279.74]